MIIPANATNSTEFYGWIEAPNQRGSIDILWSCITTVGLCSWTALCVNAGKKDDTYWSRNRRKFHLAALNVLVPEFILGLAAGQWSSAHRSVKAFASAGYSGWTMKHAYFADMGGFTLKTSDWQSFPLDAKQVLYLLSHKYIEQSDVIIDEKIIADKNKKESFVRIVTVFQISWFSITFIGRAIQNLAYTSLEVTTIGLIICTLSSYVLWFKKPNDVELPIELAIDHRIEQLLIDGGDAAKDLWYMSPLDFVSREVWSFNVYWCWWVNIMKIFVPLGREIRPIDRIPNDNFPQLTSWLVLINFVIHIAYVSVNFLAWDLQFPTRAELVLWRVASIGSVVALVLPWVIDRYFTFVHRKLKAFLTRQLGKELEPSLATTDKTPPTKPKTTISRMADSLRHLDTGHDPALRANLKAILPQTGCAMTYGAFRLIMLIQDCISFRALPPSAFQTVNWSAFLPHL